MEFLAFCDIIVSKRILIAPLDWGLGHATRCIPLIRHLLDTGNQPIIASSGRPMELLKGEFPNVESVELDGYNISYPEGSGMAWKMFQSTPHILKRIREEKVELENLIKCLKLDAVISDNRFGLYTDTIPSIYMTHQVMIKAPFFESILFRIHSNYMKNFSEVWVPDFEKDGLSGDLSHKFPLPQNAKHIGSLSRFGENETTNELDLLVLISGPEPQRTRFEKMVLSQLNEFEGTALAVLGTPDKHVDRLDSRQHRIVSHLDAAELEKVMARSRLVVSRSGYSTIMDLSALGKQAALIPTPGQTEQEYLAGKYNADGKHLSMSQRKLNLSKAWSRREEFSGFERRSSEGYKAALDQLIVRLS
ncbi:MAG: UDP:flavonoid glycosyltransferase YjiC (YdhE family) [Polaribacter sp.]